MFNVCFLNKLNIWHYLLVQALTVAVATCSAPFTATLTNMTVPTTTEVPRLPASARRTPSWWLKRSKSYENWVTKTKDRNENKQKCLTCKFGAMAAQIISDKMASFVHGRIRWVGFAVLQPWSTPSSRQSLPFSPGVDAWVTEHFACVYVCVFAWESGRVQSGLVDSSLLRGGKTFTFYPFSFFSFFFLFWDAS